MKTQLSFLLFSIIMVAHTAAQNENMENKKSDLPYYQIPDYPETYTAATVAVRMIDGLGFRYYWGTEGLRESDLAFRPNESARTSMETLKHLYGLSRTIVNAVTQKPNVRQPNPPVLTYEELRKKTLDNLKTAADLLRANPKGDLGDYPVIFKREDSSSEFPFWNLINGPIADALWHVGQVVSFRRSSGNPLNPKVSVFSGKLRN